MNSSIYSPTTGPTKNDRGNTGVTGDQEPRGIHLVGRRLLQWRLQAICIRQVRPKEPVFAAAVHAVIEWLDPLRSRGTWSSSQARLVGRLRSPDLHR